MTSLMGFQALSSSGAALALPHSAGMQSSLPTLKKNYKFTGVFFWGKLQGLKADYLIAKGIEESYGTKKFFFCQDGVSWAQLPPVTEEMMFNVAKVTTHGLMLSGDPSTQLQIPADPAPEEPPEGYEEPEPKFVAEVERIAVIVDTIEMDCAMCPAGALLKKADHTIVDSPTYGGLSYGKATSVASFVFMNQPKAVSVLTDALAASSDFLKPCSDIVPSGALTCKFDEATNTVTYRSLLYPGFMAFAAVGSTAFGYCYIGDGLKNTDIAFMLP